MTLDADKFRCGAASVALFRNSRGWQQLIEMRRVVDIVLSDLETVYAPRKDMTDCCWDLRGVSTTTNSIFYASVRSARREKAKRGELIVAAPVDFVKIGDRLEKEPDRRVQSLWYP
ncbi:hypothetical protein [Bradyrhizobium algeriense]|uniref:hypothetical protein n=1 Tax=Bradyrhizobium algeriense TaxID=634784 RepID=UPI001FCF0BFD|nr:hypothetical protein [Bradyrhizobium algeriense]